MVSELFDLPIKRYGRYDTFSMLSVCCGLNGKAKFAVYGIDEFAKMVITLLEQLYHIKPAFLIGKSDSEMQFDNIPVLSPKKFKEESKRNLFIVVVAVKGYNVTGSETRRQISAFLKTTNVYLFFGASGLLHPFKPDWWCFIKDNSLLFDDTYIKLSDQISKNTLLEYLKTYILGQAFAGTIFPEEYKYWGIDGGNRKLFVLTEDEVILNAGACKGDTIYQYIKCGLPCKKIIGVECEESNYVILEKMIDLLTDQWKEKITIYKTFLGEGHETIDFLWRDEKISLICMDVEGAELNILKTGTETIKNNRPILSICAYHKVDDLIVIPKFIEDVVSNYVFVLRKYPSGYDAYFDGIHQINELVLYAIPRERYIES